MFYGFEFIARKDAKEDTATVVRSWICLSQRRKVGYSHRCAELDLSLAKTQRRKGGYSHRCAGIEYFISLNYFSFCVFASD